MVAAEDIEALAQRYVRAHSACDLEAVLALFSAEAVLEDPVGSAPLRGLEAIRAFYVATYQRNGLLRMEAVGPVLVCGDEATWHVRAAAAAADFDPVFDVIYTLRCTADGRIAELRAYF